MKPTHTPTPLNVRHSTGNGDNRRLLVMGLGNKQSPIGSVDNEYADYVARAVNAHEELLRLVKSFHMSNGNVHSECDACEAIRKAEGK